MTLIKTGKFELTRKKPNNLKSTQYENFEHELFRKFSSPKIFTRKNIYVHQQKLWKFKYFNAYSDHWRMSNFWYKHKLSLFYRNLMNAALNRDEIKYDIISKASWVVDQKSWKYMHWFSDAMQRIQHLEKFLNEYPVIIFRHYENYEYIKYTLKRLEIPHIVLERENYYLVKELLISSHVAPSGNYHEILINNVSSRLKENIEVRNSQPSENIWISRQKATIRKVVNNKELQKILKKYDFREIILEDLSFEEQVNILSRAKILAGIQGAGLTNILFMKEETSLLEVRSVEDASNNCYFSLASALNIKYFYSDAFVNQDKGGSHSGNYEIDINDLEKSIISILNL